MASACVVGELKVPADSMQRASLGKEFVHGLVLRRGRPLTTVVPSGAKGGSASEEVRQELPRVGLKLPRHAYCTGHLDSKAASAAVRSSASCCHIDPKRFVFMLVDDV